MFTIRLCSIFSARLASPSRKYKPVHRPSPKASKRFIYSDTLSKEVVLPCYSRLITPHPSPSHPSHLCRQECTLDDFDTESLVYYCQDVCDPSPCNDDEFCELSDVVCFGPPSQCSPVATCTPIADDPCGGTCTEYQVQHFAKNNASVGSPAFSRKKERC